MGFQSEVNQKGADRKTDSTAMCQAVCVVLTQAVAPPYPTHLYLDTQTKHQVLDPGFRVGGGCGLRGWRGWG